MSATNGRRERAAAGRASFGKRPGAPMRSRPGFTLVDLVIAVFVLLILAAVALPSMRPDDRGRLIGGATRVVSDLEYARAASIGKPDDPVTLVLHDDGSGYWLALAATPTTPLAKDGLGTPYEVLFGLDDAEVLRDVAVSLVGEETGGAVVYDAFGRLNPAVAAELILTNEAGTISVLVDPWTGDAEMSAITPPEEE